MSDIDLQIVPRGEQSVFKVEQNRQILSDGVELIEIYLYDLDETTTPDIEIVWFYPIVDIYALWRPGADYDRRLPMEHLPGFVSKATLQAPVVALYSQNGTNQLTFAFSDALNPIQIRVGVHEESARLRCSLRLFAEPLSGLREYKATLRLDRRAVPYYESLRNVQQWWANLPEYQPAPVPDAARAPVYSTWYSFHQQLTALEIEQECGLARNLGCETVIVDDGWQTTDNGRGYAFCGDWQVTPEKIFEMAAHIKKVQALGLKYLLWYSVPFVGEHTTAWTRFQGKFLKYMETFEAWVLDPRFPEVREYLIKLYEDAARNWNLDGFKLDFVDRFSPLPDENIADLTASGRDYISVPAAVDHLLSDVISRLRTITPDIMVEFRQPYVGPAMRKYGNMFRAADCPADTLTNRIRTLDARLLSGSTVVHSDMLMWHAAEPVENAALQIVNVLFSVPQISVKLADLTPQHREMLQFWLSFWLDHRNLLLNGDLKPLHPEQLYPLVIAENADARLVAVYGSNPARPGMKNPPHLILVNGTLNARLILELDDDLGERKVEIRDCRGIIVSRETRPFAAGLHFLPVPPCGVAFLKGNTSTAEVTKV
jgi:alpha-galactosidase